MQRTPFNCLLHRLFSHSQLHIRRRGQSVAPPPAAAAFSGTPSSRRLREAEAVAVASSQLDPLFHNIRSAICKPNGDVVVQVSLHATRAAPDLEAVERKVAQRLQSELGWVSRASVEFVPVPASRPAADQDGLPESLHRVRHIVGVGSAKGGVGKSTVAVNLAFALAERGARVGVFDADVYGSSLGAMLKDLPGRDPVTGALLPLIKEASSGLIIPPAIGRVAALMSYGFVAPGVGRGEQKAINVRGPVASQIVNQILCGTAWGDLDYLLVDLPPGTGDIHLTLYQQMAVDGQIVVTTPHALSLADVKKTMNFLQHVNVPVLGGFENMAYFSAPAAGEANATAAGAGTGTGAQLQRHHLFGTANAGISALKQMCGLEATDSRRGKADDDDDARFFQLPIEPALADCDQCPVTTYAPDSEAAKVFQEAAGFLVQKLAEKAHERSQTPPNTLLFDPSRGRLVLNLTRPGDLHVASNEGVAAASVLDIDPAELRRRSKDAWSTSAATSNNILGGDDVPGKAPQASSADVVLPTKINRKGNYGFEVQWGDGLRGSIYGYDQLLDAAAATKPSHHNR